MEIDTWVDAAGKNGMRRDWLIRDYATGETIARATRYLPSTPDQRPSSSTDGPGD